MIDKFPLISVIIPTYNTAHYLPDAIESILAQNYPNFEIIIIDDGSTDNTVEVLSMYEQKIIYYYQQNRGPASARNQGLQLSKGKFIAFLDADDLWPKDKIRRQLMHFQKSPKTDIVIGRQRVEYLPDAKELLYDDTLISETQICQSLPIALIRKTVFDIIGNFDEELIYFEDWDWHLRARENNLNILVYDEVTNIHRRHQNNMTHDILRMNKYAFNMFRKSLKRRRENPNITAKLPSITELEQRAKNEP